MNIRETIKAALNSWLKKQFTFSRRSSEYILEISEHGSTVLVGRE